MDFDQLDLDRLRSHRGEKWRLYPDDVLAAWVAEMDFPLPPIVRDVVQAAIDRDDLGYPLHPLPTSLPGVFCERMQTRFGWKVEPRRVELLTDVVQGLYVAISQFSEPGDGVVVQTPVYPPFMGAVRELGRRRIDNPLSPVQTGGRWELDLDALAAVPEGDARVLLLCNPQNPTGRVLERAELEAIAAVAIQRNWLVVSDEIHSDLAFPGHEHIPFAALSPEAEAQTLTLTSATKAFNIPGLRCSVAVFGSDAIKRRFNALPRHVRGGLGSLGLEATEAVWRHGDAWLDEVRTYLDGNRDFLGRVLRDQLPEVIYHPPEAGYLAWLDCRALDLEPSPHAFFLERARVGLSDGRTFGPPGVGFVRLNFATPRAILSEILERMAKAVREHVPSRA